MSEFTGAINLIKARIRREAIEEVFERLDKWQETNYGSTSNRIIALEQLKQELIGGK